MDDLRAMNLLGDNSAPVQSWLGARLGEVGVRCSNVCMELVKEHAAQHSLLMK